MTVPVRVYAQVPGPYRNVGHTTWAETVQIGMKTFDVQTIEIRAPFQRTFPYIADPANLPKWTSAFETASSGRARMRTPQGCVDISLQTNCDPQHGTIDWAMTFPDQSIARAFSRVIAREDRCIYSFVLTAPAVPLELLEGALEQQSMTLREELHKLRTILES